MELGDALFGRCVWLAARRASSCPARRVTAPLSPTDSTPWGHLQAKKEEGFAALHESPTPNAWVLLRFSQAFGFTHRRAEPLGRCCPSDRSSQLGRAHCILTCPGLTQTQQIEPTPTLCTLRMRPYVGGIARNPLTAWHFPGRLCSPVLAP